MLEQGEYSYKALKYQFYEKYKNVLADESGAAETFINPPPLNLISCLLLPFLIFRSRFRLTVATKLSKTIYWVENCLLCLLMLVKEVFLIPIIAVQNYGKIIKYGRQFKNTIRLLVLWTFLCIPILVYYLAVDLYSFMMLCAYEEKKKSKNEGEEGDTATQEKLTVYQ